jgi:nucleotide-binding universal stress UspA family protein
MYQKILLASDGSEDSIKAAGVVRELAEKFGSAVTILCVVHIPQMYKVDLADELEEGILDEWNKILESTSGIFADSKIIPTKRILRDISPVEGILAEEESGDYDLVVLGRKGEGKTSRRNLGSVSHSVMQESKKSILLV